MKQDRFLIGILIGIGVLIIAAFSLYFFRQSQTQFSAVDTPAGVVQNYVLALNKEDYQKAYGYLADGKNKPSMDDFRKPFISKMSDIGSADVQIRDTDLIGNEAVVTLVLNDYYNSPYRTSQIRETAQLNLENGSWKIKQMPQPYWSYDWYQPTLK